MSGILDRKSVIIVGADEIGAGIAHRLAREGARVAIVDEDVARARSIAASLTDAFALAADYRSGDAVTAAVAQAATRLGGVHALINNVLPMPTLASLEHQSSDSFRNAFARVEAAVCAMQAVLSFMLAAGEGRIVNVGHRYGETVNEGLAAYNAAAWSLVGITRTAALDWGRYQIATNLLLPLAATAELEDARARRSKVLDLMISQIPMRRAGDCVEDVGGAALFLVSDAANFVNGEIVHADGGQHVAGPVLNPIKFSA